MLRDIRYLESLVKDCIPIPEKVYERARRATTPEEIGEYFPGFAAFIDATEQEIPRPKRKEGEEGQPLLWKEEGEAHREDAADSEPGRADSPQDEPRQGEEARL